MRELKLFCRTDLRKQLWNEVSLLRNSLRQCIVKDNVDYVEQGIEISDEGPAQPVSVTPNARSRTRLSPDSRSIDLFGCRVIRSHFLFREP